MHAAVTLHLFGCCTGGTVELCLSLRSAKQTVQQGTEAFAELQRRRAELIAELDEADRQLEEAQKQLKALEAARAEKDAPLKLLRQKREELEKVLLLMWARV